MKELKGKTIGFIGTGNMGSAIITRLSEKMDPGSIVIYDIDTEKTSLLSATCGAAVMEGMKALAEKSDIIVLAVKPDTIAPVLEEIKKLLSPEKIIVSIAAGISISMMENAAGSACRIIRIMPNTPSLVGEGMSVLSPNKNMDDESLATVEHIFSYIGKVAVLPEKHMDAVTGLSGSGPAYVFTFIQAMADGGVKMGIPRDIANILAAQTVLGSAKYALESGENPIALRDRVTSPGGTTIEAVHVLERNGFSGIIMEAVEKASYKSRILGEK